MPNKYVRISERGKWSQEDLTQAIEAVKNKGFSIRHSALVYKVPRKTLERRLKTNNSLKGPMGPSSFFGEDHEKRLVRHIINMQKNGFPLTLSDVRSLAYHFAVQLGLKHSFDQKQEKAGYIWLKFFLLRNPNIRVRKAEGISLARCQSLNRTEVNNYFDLLHDILTKCELFDKPSNIFNMDESGLQLNNRPGHVLAEKGSKAVSTVTSTEKGETITVIACCNAEGSFLPPACIMKGKNKKQKWQDGMPPGSILFMSQKSAYINAALFLEWLKIHFLPRKPSGKVLLILDGHASHCNSVEMLEFAAEHNIYLLTLPSHTTHYLQPLDRAVFKSVKTFYYEACRSWLKRNPGRRLTRLQFGELLHECWGRAATPENAIAGFRATGIYPFNRSAVPDYAFATRDVQPTQQEQLNSSEIETVLNIIDQNVPGPSGIEVRKSSLIRPITPSIQKEDENETPSKFLNEISPIPEKRYQIVKRSKQVAKLLTSEEHVKQRKEFDKKRTVLAKRKRKPKMIKQEESSDTEDEEELILLDSSGSSGMEEDGMNDCVRCGENYFKTEKIEDWLRCIICMHWLHENCTEFDHMCHPCGIMARREKENAVNKGSNKGKGKGKGKAP